MNWQTWELPSSKQQLLDAGVAAGTLTKKGEEYITMEGTATTATKGFNDSLADQWLTTDVLNKTLGDYADETTDIGKKAFAAAQDVKTFSQLMDTTKESIGSGWAQSFEILIGNFDEAKALFGGMSQAISGFVGRQAEARNALLQGWKDLGGRTLLIESLQKAFKNLAEIIAPIKRAFQNIFPPMTADRLFKLTQSFSDFVDKLKPSQATIENLERIFKGLFSVLEIGWEVVKRGAQFIGDLFTSLTGAGGGQFLTFLGNIGDFFTDLNDALVSGGGITKFFDGLMEAIKKPIPFLEKVKELIGKLFGGFDQDTSNKVSDSMQRISDRFGPLKDFFEKVGDLWKPFKKLLDKVMEIADKIWEEIKDFGSKLGDKLYEIMSSSNFDAALDALNTALLGGIALTISNFLKNGLSLNLNAQLESGGVFGKVTKILDDMTGVLTAMQANLKADTLMKIAGAIALLTASVLTLSLIDSDALTKALTAMSIGFGQLMGAFAIISKMSVGPSGAVSMTLIGASMITLAGAIALLSLSAKTLADLDWDELARGLTGVTVLLGVVVAAVLPLSKMSGSFIRTGIGLIAVAIAIRILANAVEKMASMSWGDMARGMAGVAAGLLIIGIAMKLMPAGMALQGLGLLLLATSLSVLASVVNKFSAMDWGSMAKGFAGVAAGLVIIGLATKLMPATMPLIGAGLILVGIALGYIADAVMEMAAMSWKEIGKGLTALAGSLLILAAATYAMSGSIAGAIAIGIVSASLLILAEVLKAFASIKFGELLIGLAGIAVSLALLGVAAMLLQPALPAMLLLGAALTLIGAGFALFGLGAMLVAEAFERLAKAGEKGSEALVAALKNIGRALPALMSGFAQGILEMLDMFLTFAPKIAKGLGKLLSILLTELEKLIPQAAQVIGTLISELINLIREKVPEYALLGVDILLSLLQGIRDRIDDIVIVVAEIIVAFIDALTVELPKIVESVATLITTFFTSVAEAVGRVAGTLMFGIGIAFLNGFMDGITQQAPVAQSWFTSLPTKVIAWIGNVIRTLWQKGSDFISGLLKGVTDKAVAVINWFKNLAKSVLTWIGSTISTLRQKGVDFIQGLWNGITAKIGTVSSFFSGLVSSVASWVGNTASSLWNKGYQLIQGLYDGVIGKWGAVTSWFSGLGGKVSGGIGYVGDILKGIGSSIINGLWNGMKEKWESVKDWLGGLGGAIGSLKGPPEKDAVLLVNNGMLIMQGLQVGMQDEWKSVEKWLSELDPAESMATKMANNINGVLTSMLDQLEGMGEFNPVITPVLDLTEVESGTSQIERYISKTGGFIPAFSSNQANVIATSGSSFEDDSPVKAPAGSGEVKFEQNIYSPTQLSTEDIYRQTRNQITMAKQELSIP